MKRIASLLLVLAVLLCGCSTVNEGIVPRDNTVADEQDAFVYDADNEGNPDSEGITIESNDPSENEKKAPVTEEIKEEQESSTQEEEPISPTVYRTESGECYHREGCYH